MAAEGGHFRKPSVEFELPRETVAVAGDPRDGFGYESKRRSSPARISAQSTPAEGQQPPERRRSLQRFQSDGGKSLRKPFKRRSTEKETVLLGESLGALEDLADWVPPSFQKHEAVQQQLHGALQGHFLFSSLRREDVLQVVESMEMLTLLQGEFIMRQGETGDHFYVVESGTFQVVVGEDEMGSVGPGQSFGELALMQNSPRPASLRVSSPEAVVWALDRSIYRRLVARQQAFRFKEVREALGKISLLEGLSAKELSQLSKSVTIRDYPQGYRIIQRGDEGHEMFVIKSGQVTCEVGGAHHHGSSSSASGSPPPLGHLPRSPSTEALSPPRNTSPPRLSTEALPPPAPAETASSLTPRRMSAECKSVVLGPGAWFGERALLFKDTRAADVFATTEVECYVIEAKLFELLLGTQSDVLAKMEREVKLQVVRALHAMDELDSGEKRRVADLMQVRQYKRGQVVVARGAPASHFFVVKSGEARSSGLGQGDGDEAEPEVLDKGASFGEAALTLVESQYAEDVTVQGGGMQAFVLSREDLLANGFDRLLSAATVSGSAGLRVDPAVSPHSGGSMIHLRRHGESMDGLRMSALRMSQMEGAQLVLKVHTIDDLVVERTLGCGSFGRVKLATHTATTKVLALKIMQKAIVVETKQVANIARERAILQRLKHPNVLRLYGSFQDKDNLYMLLELVPGGELFRRMHGDGSEENQLSFGESRFYAAQVVAVYDYIHRMGIVYRDLKPENLLITEAGYLKVVDWGFAKELDQDTTYTMCGTPEYLAPELVQAKGHGKAVDFWALGVVLFEMLVGYSAFVGDDVNDHMAIYERIVHGVVEWPQDREIVEPRMQSLVEHLLALSPVERLGCSKKGVGDILAHSAYEDFDYEQMNRMEMEAPWVPDVADERDVHHFDDIYDDEPEEMEPYDGNVVFDF